MRCVTQDGRQITLRALEPEDLDFLYRMENDTDLWGVSNTSVPYSRYVLHDYIANATDDIYRDGQVRLIVETDGVAVGMVDVFDFNPQHRRAELSIVIDPRYRKRGIATAVVRAMADYACHTLRLHQLYTVVAEYNKASLSLFLRCGYVSNGVMNEWLYDGKRYVDAVVLQKFF